MSAKSDVATTFLDAANVWHNDGGFTRAQAIVAAHPGIATANIYTAAALGDDRAVRTFLNADRSLATAKGGPRDWDALTYLCFSEYLRSDRARARAFLRTATLLLDAGASAGTGWWENDHQPKPEFESVIYAASAIAQDPDLTRLLLERGADPNDEETPYHSPETYENRALKVLVNSGRMTADSLSTMILRKADWHDYRGMKWLLEHGADPNRMSRWHHPTLHHAIRRDNALAQIKLLLKHGADPTLKNRQDEASAVVMAARRGRGDVLAVFKRRGVPTDLDGVDRLVAACASQDATTARAIVQGEPRLVGELLKQGGARLAEFSGVGNTRGVEILLDLGVDVAAAYEGDGYWDVAKSSTALHVAAWRAQHDTVKLLIKRGAPVDARDGKGRTALVLAVKACVDSYWTNRRSPVSVSALLKAGASAKSVVNFPSGYAAVDKLLRARGR